MFRFLFLVIVYHPSMSSAVDRIENFNIDRKSVNKVYLSKGKASVIRFPQTIEEVRVGIPTDYFAKTSKVYSKELTLRISNDVNSSSNLIVRTSNEDIYVFDLVHSKYNHQDVIFIDDSFYKTNISNKVISKEEYTKRVSLIKNPRKRVF